MERRKKNPIHADDYELLEVIGDGIGITVRRARCIPFDEVVAVKILDLERNNDLSNDFREAKTMLCNLWVVMPYMAGGSCLHIMKLGYPTGFEEVVIATQLREVLKGLEYLHQHGHIHQDVKAVSDGDVRNIVLSYLVHSCFKETAETFLACTGMKQPCDYLVDMDRRKSIFHFASEGNALRAIELTEELAQNLLEDNKDLHFDLLSLHFVDLVRSRKCTEALEFAQSKLTPFTKVHKYIEKLEDFMALLAYAEPEKSPMFHLLSPEYRQNVAENLNRAILAHANLPSYSSMERLLQQTVVVRQYLHQELGKDGPPLFSLKAFLKD